MKSLKYILFVTFASLLLLNSCDDNEAVPGNPVMEPKTTFGSAMFGDSLAFTVAVSDADVPLSTLKAQLYYGEEKVSETVIRTKTSNDYSGKIFVPYYANVPNGTATLKLVLQNIHFTITEKEYDVTLTRPDFAYLTFVTADKEYRMERTGLYQYQVMDTFPQKIKGYIKSPKASAQGNEITFGWSNGAIVEGTATPITFSKSSAGEYPISFNTLTYEGSPFMKLLVNDTLMQMVDDDNYKADMDLTQGEKLEISGISDYDQWWIDPDFFTRDADGKLEFLPVSGSYRITANLKYKYFIVETLKSGALATLQTDGTGAVWIIGEGIGKPSVADNQVGWDTGKALCLSQIEAKKYQVTVVAGTSITADAINFKFFYQKDWGGEFDSAFMSTTSDVVFIGAGQDVNGHDNGNLGIVTGKSLEAGATYVFTVDVTAGINKAVLTVTKK
ncbi:DUF5125 domain-containing protein [uncultured Bacteroides sp.]|uniref:DUF5125 domain-containing protein n=1 Tax=uncultured Bacteroides sp. TaxID=162156 RepID=UPI002AA68423|nr:DUF5125 domain-containing protein [uncultured Bacteroides sp.]